MRVFTLLLVAMPALAQADTVKPTQAPSKPAIGSPSVIILPSANNSPVEACRDGVTTVADRKPAELSRNLVDEPNATLLFALHRKVGPCNKPIVIGRDIGSRPDLPVPSVSGNAQSYLLPPQ